MSTKKDKKAVKSAVVGVCVPARDEVHTGFAFDFARMVGMTLNIVAMMRTTD